MPVSLNTTLRNNRADQITSFSGTSAKLRIYTAAYATQLVECICNASAFAGAAARQCAADRQPSAAPSRRQATHRNVSPATLNGARSQVSNEIGRAHV